MRTHIPVSAWMSEPAEVLETAIALMYEQIEAEKKANK